MPSLKYENSPSKGSFYTQEKVEILTNKEQEQDAQHGNTQNPEQEQEAPDGNNNPNPEKNNKGVIKRYF